jgi:hypothetical protein
MPRSDRKKAAATVRSHSGTKSGSASQTAATKSRGNPSSRKINGSGFTEDDREDSDNDEEDEEEEEEEEQEEMEAAFDAAEEEEEEGGGGGEGEEEEEDEGEVEDEDEEGHDGDDDQSGVDEDEEGNREDDKMDGSARGFLCNAYQGMPCSNCKGYIGFSSRICKHCQAPVKKSSTSRSRTSRTAPRFAQTSTSKKKGGSGLPSSAPVPAPVGKKSGTSYPTADDADKEGRLSARAPRSGRSTEDDDMPDHLTKDAYVVSKNGPVAHMKQLDAREGHAYLHTVSRPKTLPPAPCFAPLSPLNGFSMKQIEMHIRALQGETFQRRYRLVVTRLMEHTLNADLFNSPVDPSKYQIADYFEVIKQPMDLGTVRQKLEAGRYNTSEELAADVLLTFNNAMKYNPVGHHVYNAAWRLKDEFSADYSRLTNKTEGEARRKDAHKCGFCHGQMCKLCGDKCLRFDPPIMSCDCCMERIKRGDVYYRAPSGQRWCARCVSNGGINAEPGAILPPIALLRTTSTETLEGMMKLLGAPGTGHIAAAALAASSSGPQKVNSFERQLPTILDGSALSSSSASGSGENASSASGTAQNGNLAVQKTKMTASATLRKVTSATQAQEKDKKESSSKTGGGVSVGVGGVKFSTVPPLQIASQASPATATTSASGGGKTSSLLNLGGSHHATLVSVVSSGGSNPTPSKKKEGLAGTLIKQENVSSIGLATARPSQQTEVTSSASTSSSGLSPAQLLAALKAAGVDTSAVAIAAQAAAALQHAPTTNGRVQLLTLQSLASVLRGRHERRRNDDVVAEPWVQCDRCKGWLHQICAMFNARKNALLPFNAEYICPCCRLDDLKASQGTVSSRSRAGSRADKQVSPEARNSLVIPQVSFAPTNYSFLNAPGVPPPTVRTRSTQHSGEVSASAGSGLPALASAAQGTSRTHGSGHMLSAGTGSSNILTLNRSGTSRQVPVAPLIQFSSTIKYEGHAAIATAAALGVGSADDGIKETTGKNKAFESSIPQAHSGGEATSSPLFESHGASTLRSPVVISASSDPYVTAGSLPHTPLSKELESKVRERLRVELKSNPDVADSIVVRVVSSLKKSIIVPKEVVSCFTADAPNPSSLVETAMNTDCLFSTATESVARQNGVPGGGEPSHLSARVAASPPQRGFSASSNYAKEYASEYTYRQRVVLLWQRLDGVDMCLFALFVQEYGPDCPPPNTRKIYIAYLDSVRYLRPISARTACYHELLAAYLGNARRRGFDTCHIWACEYM